MTDERSPYAAPESDVEVSMEADGIELASRWARLGGAIIDGLLVTIPLLIYFFMSGYWDRSIAGEVTAGESYGVGLAWVVMFLGIQGYLLATSGQTVGKRLLSMRIVSVQDNQILPIGKVVGLRYLPFWVIGYIPLIGNILSLINVLAIFGAEKRCVHDYLAGTRVIKVQGEVSQSWG